MATTTTTETGRGESGYTYDSFTGTTRKAKQPLESHFLWWCSGAYQQLLKDCPSEQTKYAGMGGVLLATFVLASLSAGYAIYSVFADPLWAVLFALVWGLIIFNFDRFLVSTMRKYGVSQRKQVWMAAPRLALALLIGFTIARPLELKVFEKEIDVQLAARRHQQILLNDSLLQAENRTTLLAAQQERDRLDARKTALEDTLHQLQQDYIREADGTGGSQRRGIDKLTRLKQQAFESARQQFTPELRQLESQIRYQDSLIAAANAGRALGNRQYEAQVKADVGFLERNKALADLSAKEPSVFWTSLLLSLLIILIETGPILSKLIMNTGPYDLALASLELKQMAAAENAMRRDKELRQEKEDAIRAKQKAMTGHLLEQLSDLQKKYVREELDQWERGVDTQPGRKPLEEVVRGIRERYGFKGEDIL
jgi:hypothetical protein